MGGREEDRPAGGTTSTAASLVVAHHLLDQPEEVAPFIQQGGAWCQMEEGVTGSSLGRERES